MSNGDVPRVSLIVFEHQEEGRFGLALHLFDKGLVITDVPNGDVTDPDPLWPLYSTWVRLLRSVPRPHYSRLSIHQEMLLVL